MIEDTFILLDALEHDIPRLRQLSSQKTSLPIVIEIGSFAPVVPHNFNQVGLDQAVSLRSFKRRFSCLVNAVFPNKSPRVTVVLFSLDISFPANLTTTTTLEWNVPRQFNSVVQCDLLNGLRVHGGVDVLVFNPPYVPTEEDDSWAGDIGFAWKGGRMGMQTTWRVLEDLEVKNCG